MPSINRIRVNNVKYNFGSQYYDDFTMRMQGKNTLYDLANGGGKSVLMLLLLQNMIPNCTLDEKQPIEKLFRTGNGNTTIHSLIEWKLDEKDRKDGYRYMTTGFCARKAKEGEGEEKTSSDVASIEYFNYCIFYRDYNKNDIINLPLVTNKERITFQGLRSYLKDLPHRDMNLEVHVFDRKGEYQRFISNFGLHESQWEIIRGINKTEGHVRTYFETNYKTTRKVVEDLLIEEIIEKAYMVKTEKEEDGSDSMARMLMDIKEQLTILAKKKKDISGYDHQIELLRLLSDKVSSFMDLYEEQSRLSLAIANICVTGEQFLKNDEANMQKLEKMRDEKREQKNAQRQKIENLKVARDKKQLEALMREVNGLEQKVLDCDKRLLDLESDLNMKESVNEYIEYVEDRKKYFQQDAVVKAMMADSSFDEELLYTYVYNIKMRMDVMLTDIRKQKAEIEEALLKQKTKQEYEERLLAKAKTELAVCENQKKQAEDEIVILSEKLSAIRMSMNHIRFTKLSEQLLESEEMKQGIEARMVKSEEIIKECERLLSMEQLSLAVSKEHKTELEVLLKQLKQQEQEYKEAQDKLSNIELVYGVSKQGENTLQALSDGKLANIISDRITKVVLEIENIKQKILEKEKIEKRLSEGRLLGQSDAVKKMITYIETRHGLTAMYGMDYLSALPQEKQREILEQNPELAYGVVVKEFEKLLEDPNIATIDLGDTTVNVYDMDAISEKGIIYGDNVFAVHPSKETLTDKEAVERLMKVEGEEKKELSLQLEIKKEMLATYRQDHTFVVKLSDSVFLNAAKRLLEETEKYQNLLSAMEKSTEKIKNLQASITKEEKNYEEAKREYEKSLADLNKLYTIEQLSDLVEKQEKIEEACGKDMERLEEQIRELSSSNMDCLRDTSEDEARIHTLKNKEEEILREWNDYYKQYYNIDHEYDILTISDDEIKAKVVAMVKEGFEDAKAIDDKKLLLDTLKVSMDRSIKNIEKRGVDIKVLADYEARGLLYEADAKVLENCRKAIEETVLQKSEIASKLKEKQKEADKLEGSIEYAIKNIKDAFGEYIEEQASLSEIVTNLENGETLLSRLEQEARDCEEEFRKYSKEQGYMLELYKDVKRIVVTNDISLEHATVIMEEKDKLREIFEDNLVKFDRSTKSLEKAKNELLKYKGNTAVTLDQMEVYELAATIRDDVVIPSDYEQAKLLRENLTSITDYIALERDRVEKSLTDMETIKANFEEQCLQRCLDVRTELDKLPKLSRIIMDGEAIQMVGLTIPYVKDEFLKQRMSDYIEKVVAQADDYDNDKERMKYIRNSLALKRLFGVIVTDMNGIKLSLYKRERIKEQSRYLKYEEAVGSTGQSQGIYIQFLVSIIHYISGMYQVGNEDSRTNTIFIDNPFGAAKDVYIWEPIFALLAANHVQLIVPARGATPAITGRFDVNYILGQQMSGGKQLTVVTDYSSRVDQQEVEYQDLEYEQVSFDFI